LYDTLEICEQKYTEDCCREYPQDWFEDEFTSGEVVNAVCNNSGKNKIQAIAQESE
jgi:hypothetical protein